MVKLPTKEDLGPLPAAGGRGPISRANPKAPDYRLGVVDYRVRARALELQAKGLQDLGRGVSAIGAAIESVQREDDTTDLIRAEAQAARSRLDNARTTISDAGAYDSWGETFTEAQSKSDGEAASLIENPRLRERFEIQNQTRTAEARDSILDQAVKRDKEVKYANVLSALENDRQIYLSRDTREQDKASILRGMDGKLNLALRADILTPAQYTALSEKYVKGVAKEDAEILLLNDPDALKDELDGIEPFRRRLVQREASGDPTKINQLGYAGAYQFGAPRLIDLGMYRLGKDERIDKGKWKGEKWSGSFHIDEFPDVHTIEDFLASPEAQNAAFKQHVRLMDREIKKNGFDQYLGHTIAGVPITKEGLYGMLHLGGVGSTRRALESQGQENPADENGTTVLEYAALGSSYSRYASLDPVDRAELINKADAAIDRDPDLRAASREIAKTGYDMMLDDSMSADWLAANRDMLTVSDYKAFLKSLEPGSSIRKMEPSQYLKLFDLADNDPTQAMQVLRNLYNEDAIAKDDFKSLFSKAKQNAESTRGRPYSTEIRSYVQKQLAPKADDPKSLQSRQLDALFQFDDWLEANPGATREETRKQAQTIIDDYRKIRYASGVSELPAPKFVSVPRDKIDKPALDAARAKLVEEIKAKKLEGRTAAEQAALLRRWYDLVQFGREQ